MSITCADELNRILKGKNCNAAEIGFATIAKCYFAHRVESSYSGQVNV